MYDKKGRGFLFFFGSGFCNNAGVKPSRCHASLVAKVTVHVFVPCSFLFNFTPNGRIIFVDSCTLTSNKVKAAQQAFFCAGRTGEILSEPRPTDVAIRDTYTFGQGASLWRFGISID